MKSFNCLLNTFLCLLHVIHHGTTIFITFLYNNILEEVCKGEIEQLITSHSMITENIYLLFIKQNKICDLKSLYIRRKNIGK